MRPIYRLVPDFIIPHLNNSTYGSHLLWEDKRQGSFKISRIHQSSDMWNEQCIEVYKAWSMKKKHWNAHDPKRITRAKHRLITALRRSPEIEMLEKESAFYRFRIVHPEISDMILNRKNSTGDLPAISAKNKYEINRYLEPTEDTENCITKNTIEDSKEQNDQFVFNIHDPYSTQWPNFQSEMHDVQKEAPILDYNFAEEMLLSETRSTSVSDKCCCIKLLDTYLCNQKCIWHGVPP